MGQSGELVTVVVHLIFHGSITTTCIYYIYHNSLHGIQITFLKMVFVMHVKIPSSDFGRSHVISRERRRLRLPKYFPTVAVFVTNGD